MKILFNLLTLLFSIYTFGQSGGISGREQDIDPIIRYFNFYEGVQMIQLDYLTAYERKVQNLEQSQPRALSWRSVLGNPPENVYIFRNEAGIRIKKYGKISSKVKLLNVKKSKKIVISHNSFNNRFAGGIGYYKTSFFPYYLVGARGKFQNKLGLIDSLGNVVLESRYHDIFSNLGGSLFITRKDSTYELRNRNLMINYSTDKYELRITTGQNKVEFSRGNLRGIMDNIGEIIIPCEYTMIYPYNNDSLARVRNKNGLEGFVDSSGTEVIECKYQNFGEFSEGLINARLNGKWGYIDTEGKTIIPFNFNIGISFQNGLARVAKKIDGTYYFGFIDTLGNEVIPLKYSAATDFKNGVAEVRVDFTNNDLYIIVPPEKSSNRKHKKQGVWIKIDKSGKEIK